MAKAFSPQFKSQALDVLAERRRLEGDAESVWASCGVVADSLGEISRGTLYAWYRRQRVEAGEIPVITAGELEELRRLRSENRDLRHACEILAAAWDYFEAPVRPPREDMVSFIDAYRDRFGVELICQVLGEHMEGGFISSRAYRAGKSRPPSDRSVRDEILIKELARIHATNNGVYGIRRMWHAMREEGWDVGRDQVARLMRKAGLSGGR